LGFAHFRVRCGEKVEGRHSIAAGIQHFLEFQDLAVDGAVVEVVGILL
jgi:hypothetical protein